MSSSTKHADLNMSTTVPAGRAYPDMTHVHNFAWSGGEIEDPEPGMSGPAMPAVLLSGLVLMIGVPVLLLSGKSVGAAFGYSVAMQFVVFLGTMLLWFLFQPASSAPAAPRAPQTSPRRGADLVPEQDVWRSYAGHVPGAHTLRIACAAPNSAQSHSIGTDLAGLGHEMQHSTDIDAILDSVAISPEDWDVVIVDLDLSDDTETLVEDLLVFRSVCPDLPVILISSEVSRDDLSREREAIGDATLRKPVFRKRLIEGISAARDNAALRSDGPGLVRDGALQSRAM